MFKHPLCGCWQIKLLVGACQGQSKAFAEAAMVAGGINEDVVGQQQLLWAQQGLLQWAILVSQVRHDEL